MKVIAIGGEPATGKSTLVFSVLKHFGWPTTFGGAKSGLMWWQQCPEHKLLVLGKYSTKEKFCGTDRLAMNVQTDAMGVMSCFAGMESMQDWTVIFEGDRLFNKSFLGFLKQDKRFTCHWIVLQASSEVTDLRHKNRADTQTSVWLKGRVTKVKNLINTLDDVILLDHNTEDEGKTAVKKVLKLIRS